ncbi:MAG TPA: tetratricopeptide repeat protein [Vineibacter sp.]|nr:tetratricopeptide repeat protein [Vineibacter sp.]
MRAEVLPKPELPGHAVLRVHELSAAPDGLTICIERRQGPEKYLSDGGWQRSESWLAPEHIQGFGGGIDFHVGPIVCDMVAGLTVRLSVREPGVGNIGATVVAWPSMQTSGAYDPNRMVTDEAAGGTDRGFGTGSAPTTVARMPQPVAPVAPPPVAAEPPPLFQPATEPPPLFQPASEPPPPFQFGPQGPPPPFGSPPPFGAAPPGFHPGLGAPDPATDRIGGAPVKKSSAGLWIGLSVIAVLLLSGVGAGAFWWFVECDWCRVTAQSKPGTDDPTKGPAKPERVLASEYLATKPKPQDMVEMCRNLRQDGRQVAAFLVCRAAAEADDPVGAVEYASFFDPVNRAANSPVDSDGVQAAQWYEKAAKVELPVAMRRLGQLYAKGADNFPADKSKAREWLTKAADKGDAEAKKALTEL